MGTTPATFNGSSQFAGSLQQAITHAVAIASIPITGLENNVGTLQGQSNELSTQQDNFAALQTSLQSLSSVAQGTGNLSASVADSTVASVALNSTSTSTSGSYLLNVTSVGAPTTTLSLSTLPTVADPASASLSSSSSFTLTVGSSNFTITPTANNLSSLAQAINGAGSGVNATLVNIGPPSSPSYFLSLQSTTLGDETIQLNDGSKDLLSTLTHGSLAQYQLDGQPATPISSNSSTVTIAPGVTVNLLKVGQTTVTVSPDPSAASNALSSFVAAYNAASMELGKNHGNAGGALTGQSIVFQLEQSLRDLTGYTGGDAAVSNLAALGVSFNSDTGQLAFDQAQFQGIASSNPNDVSAFLGSVSSGTGFLGTATNILKGVEDPISGAIQSSLGTVQQQIQTDDNQITQDQASITTMQNQLTEQMAKADAAIATLESQVTFFTTLFSDTQNASKNG